MLKWLGGGNGAGSKENSSRSTQVGKLFHIEGHHVVVEDVIAEGGFAIVYLVKAGNNRRLALKRLAVNNEQDLYLTRQEIAITKALSDCPHSVTYMSSVTKQMTKDVHEVLILMELYTGVSVIDLLNQHLSAGTKLPEGMVLHVFSDVCVAVGRLHHRTKPIIHRDLKIENILHDSRTNAYILCDYGSCCLKPMHPEEMGATECSDEIARFTTLAYRSPEMVSVYSGKTITTKSDIWALGVLLYKLCFMETPFGEQPLAIVSGQFNIPVDSPYSNDLHSLIGYLLTPDPHLRPTIWQVCDVAFRIRRMTNPLPNIFRSPRPPNPLRPLKVTTPTKSTSSKSSNVASSSSSSKFFSPNVSPRPNLLAVTTTTISSRDRPRAKGQLSGQPERNAHSASHQTNGKPIAIHTHHKSESNLLDSFGHEPFGHQRVRSDGGPVTDSHKPDRTRDDLQLGFSRCDQFGCPPFVDHSSNLSPVRNDLFGAPPFTGHTDSSVDAFGAKPF